MVSLTAFAVVSEFKFDVANAMVKSTNLQNKVDDLDQSIKNVGNSAKSMGLGFLASFSGGNAGILGILGNAIKASDKFKSTQIELANTIVSNGMRIDGSFATFNGAMEVSGTIMDGIIDKAKKLKISPDALLEQSKMFATPLAAKGLAGNNFENATELARVANKATPALGVSFGQTMSGIMSGITGQLSKNTQFGRRLFLDSGDAIKKKTGISNIKEFNKAKPEKRVKALIVGLDKLAGSTETVNERAKTFGASLDNLMNVFRGAGSILKPLGEAFIKPLVKIMDFVAKQLNTNGKDIAKALASVVGPMIEGPKKLLLNYMMLDGLAKNIAVSAGIVSLILTLKHMQLILGMMQGVPMLAGFATFLSGIFNWFLSFPILGSAVRGLMGMFSMGGASTLGGVVMGMIGALGTMVGMFSILLIPIIGLSRAIDRMKLDSLQWIADNMASVIDTFNDLKISFQIFFAPIQDMITGFEELFYAMFSGTFVLDALKWSLEAVATGFRFLSDNFLKWYAGIRSVIAGLTGLLFQFFVNLGMVVKNAMAGNFKDILFGTESIGGAGADDAISEYDKTIARFTRPNKEDGKDKELTSAKTVINQDITMNNAFKEVLQPDRIAFTIQSQLMKSAVNSKGKVSSLAGKQAGAI